MMVPRTALGFFVCAPARITTPVPGGDAQPPGGERAGDATPFTTGVSTLADDIGPDGRIAMTDYQHHVRRIRGSTVDTLAGDVADGNRGDGTPYNRVRLVDTTP